MSSSTSTATRSPALAPQQTAPLLLVNDAPDVHITKGVIQGFGWAAFTAVQNVIELDDLRVIRNGVGVLSTQALIVVRRSFINENLGDGIHLEGDGQGLIFDSQIAGNGSDGIEVSTAIDAERNVITRNHGNGIYSTDFGTTLRDNQVTNNGSDGIYEGPNFYPDPYIMTNNTATGNGGHGIDYEADYFAYLGVPIHATTFEGNVARDNKTAPQCINIFCRSS